MSAIAGLLHCDGRPVSRRALERAANALSLYGPDGAAIALDGAVGFVHAQMRMTPQDRFDRQPCRGESGALLAADLRLDNRDDLLARLGIAAADAEAWPDSRLLLAAWERFGDAVWPLLRGPFAAAIWQPRRRVLTLARDPLGLNVLMWHRGARFFAFASMPNGLLALPEVPRVLNEEKFADFLVLNHADHATTMYRDIFRVPPAHVMHVTADGAIRRLQYWSVADIKPIRLASDEAYAEGLRDCLDRAVRRQMRSIHPLGALLSGGLDSSSVAVLAARALAEQDGGLSAFTGVPRRGFAGRLPEGHYADPRPFVDALARMAGNVDVTCVENDGDDFAEFERVFLALGGPVRNPTNLAWGLALLRRARAQGRRVLLGGLRGNATIGWSGWSQAGAQIRRGRWLTAYRQWRLFYRLTPYSGWVALRKLFIEPAVPPRLARWADRHRHPQRIAPWQDHAPIQPAFAAAMAVDARAERAGHDFLYRMRQDERGRSLALADYAGDWHAAEKAITGVEVRDPTADLDVVAYCFGVPQEQYLAEDIDRSLIRRAMWGLLPDAILTGRSSGLQAADWYEKLASRRGEIKSEITALAQSPSVRRMIDIARLERAIDAWPQHGWHTNAVFQEYNLVLTRGIAAARFLRWFDAANGAAPASAAEPTVNRVATIS